MVESNSKETKEKRYRTACGPGRGFGLLVWGFVFVFFPCPVPFSLTRDASAHHSIWGLVLGCWLRGTTLRYINLFLLACCLALYALFLKGRRFERGRREEVGMGKTEVVPRDGSSA